MSRITTTQALSPHPGHDRPAGSRRMTAVAGVAAASLLLSACSSGGADSGSAATGPTGGTATVTQPATAPAGGSPAAPSATEQHNDADVRFVSMMIPHHQGAIEMADLALARASSAEVKKLAAAIKAAQGPEIEQLQGWLDDWGMPAAATSAAAPMSGMDHAGMAPGSMEAGGMGEMAGMSRADMDKLKSASGAEFDKLFLTQMIAHHQGAIDMSDAVLANGSNPQVKALAQQIKDAQQEEITTMEGLLAGR